MRAFTKLFDALDATTKTNAKVEALAAYFRSAPPEDAVWALSVLLGRRLIRAVSSTKLRAWACEASGLPPWLVAECHEAVGDLSETLALLVPGGNTSDERLHRVIEGRILPLEAMTEQQQREAILECWGAFDARQRFLFHKLISQSFRVGVSSLLVTRALAQVADDGRGIDQAVMAHRLTAKWKPTADDFRRLLSGAVGEADAAQPYPFYLASPLEQPCETLGDLSQWQVEWKWDGIRVQIIRRGVGSAAVMLAWSRGEELVTDSFPEAVAVARALQPGTVIDGEILAWERSEPLAFSSLQKRLGRKNVAPMLFADPAVKIMAYDLLEHQGVDIRQRPLEERRQLLERVVAEATQDDAGVPLMISPVVTLATWDEVPAMLKQSRGRKVEGLMLKHRHAPYRVGRVRGDWWKWKVEPFSLDMVLVAAQQGSGRRAGLFTDYTFAVWSGGELVPVAKAYSGLSQEEIAVVDKFVRKHTTGRHGPVRTVDPLMVFEVAFEAAQYSTRHRSGVAVRFPRIVKIRTDKKPIDADHIEALRKLIAST